MTEPARSPAPVRLRLLGRQIEYTGLFFLVVYLVIAFIYYTAVTSAGARLDLWGKVALGLLMLAQGVLHYTLPRWQKRTRSAVAYLSLQTALIALSVLLAREWFVAALLFALVGEGVGMLGGARGPLIVPGAGLLAWVLCTSIVGGVEGALGLLPTGASIIAFVALYVGYFEAQERERARVEGLLRELEAAHGQLQAYAARVEELTISHERQRFARELHDTLAQGLAGLIMQLEAIDSLLGKGNQQRAREVARQAVERARGALSEARRSIQALRSGVEEEGSLVEAVQCEVDRFSSASGVPCTFSCPAAAGLDTLSPALALDALRVVREGLANVARHARARHAAVELRLDGQSLVLVVRDDGVGFTPQEASARAGHFGLLGLEERARLAGGHSEVVSAPGRGTELRVELPLSRREVEVAL